MALRYIVTGTGRCGTNYLAKLLCSAGVPCGRESVFNTSLKPVGKLLADSSWMALPYLERNQYDATVVHLVRNPWDIMRGWLFDFESVFSVWRTAAKLKPTNRFLIKHTPVIQKIDSPITRAMLYYIDWNKRIRALAHNGYRVIRVRAEDSEKNILTNIGIDTSSKKPLFDNRKENTRKRCILTRVEVDCLLRSQGDNYIKFVQTAKEYGYENP